MRTRARLVAVGRHLIGTRGLEGTAVADIAQEADVGVGSFYNYFRSKDELLAAVAAETSAALGDVLDRLTAGMADPAEIVAACVRHVVRMVDRDPTWARFVVRASDGVAELIWRFAAPIERHVLAGIERGRFMSDDQVVATNAVGGALLQVMRAKLRGGVARDADRILAEQLLRLLGIERELARAIAARPLPSLARPTGHDVAAALESGRDPSAGAVASFIGASHA
jgi:AcrR family transcriptional regulator